MGINHAPPFTLSGSSPSKDCERQQGENVQPPGTSEAGDFLTLSTDLDLLSYYILHAAANNKDACVITIAGVTPDVHRTNTTDSFITYMFYKSRMPVSYISRLCDCI